MYCWGDSISRQYAAAEGLRAAPPVGVRLGATGGSWDDAPVRIRGAAGVVSLAAGFRHVCGIDGAGQIVCWGRDCHGELSDGALLEDVVRVQLPGPAVAVALGTNHTCAALSGKVLCWGGQEAECLSADQATLVAQRAQSLPQRVDGIGATAVVAAGFRRSCGLSSSGDLTCWGRPHALRMGLAPRERVVAVDATSVLHFDLEGDSGCLLDASVRVRCWGRLAGAFASPGRVDTDAAAPPGRPILRTDACGRVSDWY